MAALNRSESDVDMDQSDVRIERPDRTNQMTLNPKQTRRLAAIFGLQWEDKEETYFYTLFFFVQKELLFYSCEKKTVVEN